MDRHSIKIGGDSNKLYLQCEQFGEFVNYMEHFEYIHIYDKY